MTIKQLHYFIAVAETKSFTHAARNYYIAQTAMSQQISALEKELGFLLFHRTNRMVELTDAGRVLYEEIRPLALELENALHKAAIAAGTQEQVFRIGIFDQADNRFLTSALKEFSRLEPDVIPMLISDNQNMLLDALARRSIDAVLLDQRFYRARSTFTATELYSHSCRDHVLAVSTSHPLARCGELSWEDLENLPLIAYSPLKEDQEGIALKNLLKDNGVTATVRFSVRDIATALLYVEAGMGCCLLPSHAKDRKNHQIKMLPIREDTRDTMLLLCHKDSDSHLLSHFATICMQTLRNP